MNTGRQCEFEGCGRPHRAKGYCSGHYQQLHHGLDISPIGALRGRRENAVGSTREFFWARIKKTDACWLWEGKKTVQGYGQLRHLGRTLLAHRYSWELINGPIPERAYIDHRCHTPSCVNPEHLRSVTPKQNMENRRGANMNNISGIRDVHWIESRQKWRVRLQRAGGKKHIGYFHSKDEAEQAALAARMEYYTHSDGR